MTKKVSVTYHAPKGDSKVVEAFGHTFFDGKAEEIEIEDYAFNKLKNNANFQCGKESDVDPNKRDAAKDKAADEAQKREDDAKRQAQEGSRPLRGAVNPNLPAEGDDKEGDKSKTHTAQAGRDH
jgi:hypothetical protein